ncbi:uncharacterized protein PV09_06923 [Verruconis gallopava]|uniref:Amidohydrolase-related domain-containing protein n=1 Tax=Verruconis gallopava TaxID=253628 RepID=A0A0D1YLM7_9PEZI|nr:uncharacterized protein PV09_06923 [Verruconis gallopava]KIW01747.1 hypothetical protein PV09_06923 [Verruconis gallopava]
MEDSFILKNVSIFTGDDWIDSGCIAVRNGIINYVGRGDPPARIVPEGTAVLSLPRRSVIPGLIDSRVHCQEGNIECLEQSLRFGVTTVCDMYGDPQYLNLLTQQAQDPVNKDKYADFKCAGIAASIESEWPGTELQLSPENKPVSLEFRAESLKAVTHQEMTAWQSSVPEDILPKLKSAEDAEHYVREQVVKFNASYIKIMHGIGDDVDVEFTEPRCEVQNAVVDAAHRRGLIVLGHALSYSAAMDLLSNGVDGLTNIFIDRSTSRDWIELLKRNKGHLCPTLSFYIFRTLQGDDIEELFASDPFSERLLFDKSSQRNVSLGSKPEDAAFANAVRNVQEAYKAGVPFVIGSASTGREIGPAYGLGVHIEMYLLSKAVGMTPMEVLKSATSEVADRFGFHDRGRVAVGKKADLVLVEGDVREAIADPNCRCLPVSCVWREGVSSIIYQRLAGP